MFGQKIWAMDLGRSAVKGVLASSAKDGIEIHAADMVTLQGEPPQSRGEPSRDKRLWKAIQEFEDRHQIHKKPIAISIPAQNTLIREIQIALVGKRNIEELVEYEAANAIPFVLDEVFWDYHLFEVEGDPTTRNGLLFAVKKNPIRTYLQAFSQIGADRVVEITMAPVAGLSFMRYQLQDDACIMLLDVGAENTSLEVINGNQFGMRNMTMGGNHITRLLRDTFEIPFKRAEEAKQNITRSKMAGQLVKAIKPGLHQLVGKIKTNLEYLERQDTELDCDQAFAVGGSTRLAGVKAQLRQSLGHEFTNIRSLKNIYISPKANSEFIKSNLDRLVVAIGTGITGLEESKVQASFLPESAARLARISSTKQFFAISSILVWVLLLSLYFFANAYDKTLDTIRENSSQANQQYSRHMQRLSDAKDTAVIEREIRWMENLGEGRTQVPVLFAEIVRIFNVANEDGESRFGITDLDIEKTATNESDQGEVIINLSGRMQIPPETDSQQAYTWLKDRVVSRLHNSHLMSRSMGSAEFKKDQQVVTSDEAQWESSIQSGDQVTLPDIDETFRVDEVESDTKLLLNQAFPGESSEGEYIISRIDVGEWNHQTLQFQINAKVPAENVTVLAD